MALALVFGGMLGSGCWASACELASGGGVCFFLQVRSAEGGVLVPGPQRDGLSCGARAGCSGWLVGLLGEGARRTVMRASA